MRRALLLLVLLAPSAFAQRQPEQSLVLTASRALMVLEPRMAVAQNVLSFSTSPSGRYLVAVQEVPSPRLLELGVQPPEPLAKKLVVWDSATGTGREIVLHKDSQLDQTTVEWFVGTEKALVHVSTEHWVTNIVAGEPFSRELKGGKSWLIVDAATASQRDVLTLGINPYEHSQIVASPVAGYAVRLTTKFSHYEREDGQVVPGYIALQRLDVNGAWAPEVRLPQIYANIGRVGWSPDGRTMQVEIAKAPPTRGRYEPRILMFNPMDGSFTDVVGPVPSYEPKAKDRDVSVTYVVTPLESPSEKRMVATWWLKSAVETKNTKAVIAEHAMMADLPQGERFVAFVANGTLFTRQIIQLSIEQYEQMRAAAERAAILSRAKQVGLAVTIYATDYDDRLPPNLGIEQLAPYLKNEKIYEGFVMVFPGGSMHDIKDIARTVMGYIDGPGGRAVVYMDTHVEWENKGG